MKRLVSLSHLEAAQYEEVARLLREAGIATRESPSNFVDLGALWVADADFPRAREILRKQSAAFAARSREAWERDWQSQHRGSWWRWFEFHLAADPLGTLIRLALLLAMVAIFVVLPAAYILRNA